MSGGGQKGRLERNIEERSEKRRGGQSGRKSGETKNTKIHQKTDRNEKESKKRRRQISSKDGI